MAEKEYIERESAVKAAQEGADEWDGGYNRNRDSYIECAIDKLTAADVVEVVRCKDCCKRDICRTSTVWAVVPKDDWFCADGERRDDNG